MRDIIFRAQDYKGNWHYGYISEIWAQEGRRFIINPIECSYDHTGMINQNTVEVKPETIGQFIGIIDTDGDKIFEGDICKKTNGNIGVIKYLTDRDNFSVGFFLVDESGYVMKIEPCTRIGNIHENPELLKPTE